MDFGQLLLERGLINPRDLEDALADQRRYIVEGREPVPRLGEILVQRGCLTEAQVAEALQSQQKEIFYCPKCDIQVNVELRIDAAGYRCGTCQGDLIRPSEVRNVRVADTSVIMVTKEPIPEEVQQAAHDPARKFGKYVLLEEIGRGGAAIVHRAWDAYLNQFVALKFIKPPPGADEKAKDSRILDLLKEARSAIRLRHPNIVTIYDVGRIDRQFYIAMDCLEGRSLLGLVRIAREQGKISPLYDDPRRFVAILRDVARAVHYAHTRQTPVIHCDLKPSNIFIDTRWRPVILDFGLARHLGPTETDAAGAPLMIRGTPAYMAPEQAAGRGGEGIDTRTDVYGLGAVLYELLAGRPPFSGDVLEMLRRVRHEMPDPPTELVKHAAAGRPVSALLPVLERMCMKCLEKDKSARYPTVKELADELERILRGDTSPRPAESRVPSPTPAPQPVVAAAAAPAHDTGALVRGAVVVEGWLALARRHWRGAIGLGAGVAALMGIVILMHRPPPPAISFEERVRLQLEDLKRRIEGQTASLQLEQAQRTYSEAASIVPPDGRRWLEDAQEDVDVLITMRNHLIAVINKPTRYAPAVFRMRDRELHDVEVLRATPEKLVIFVENHAAEVPWAALDPETVAKMISSILVGVGGSNHLDRLGLGIYCAKNGFNDQARMQFEALRGTDIEFIARRQLARLELKQR